MSDKKEALKTMFGGYIDQAYWGANAGKDVLRFVPDHLKTAEMCEAAVEYSAVNLWDVPCRFITKEMCERVVREYSGKDILRLIPDRYCTGELLTKELCEKAVLHNYENLTSVPYECLTEEIWDSAKDHLFFP